MRQRPLVAGQRRGGTRGASSTERTSSGPSSTTGAVVGAAAGVALARPLPACATSPTGTRSASSRCGEVSGISSARASAPAVAANRRPGRGSGSTLLVRGRQRPRARRRATGVTGHGGQCAGADAALASARATTDCRRVPSAPAAAIDAPARRRLVLARDLRRRPDPAPVARRLSRGGRRDPRRRLHRAVDRVLPPPPRPVAPGGRRGGRDRRLRGVRAERCVVRTGPEHLDGPAREAPRPGRGPPDPTGDVRRGRRGGPSRRGRGDRRRLSLASCWSRADRTRSRRSRRRIASTRRSGSPTATGCSMPRRSPSACGSPVRSAG